MYSETRTDEKYIWNLYEYTADFRNDISSLPTDSKKIRPGSTCFCIEDSSVWMLGHDYVWHEI